MAVYSRGNGFQADFMIKGQRFRGQFATEAEAEKWEFDTRAAHKAGKPLPEAAPFKAGEEPKGSISEALRLAKERRWSYQRGSTRTVLNAEAFVAWAGADTLASKALTEENIHAFVRYLLDERRVSGSTVNRYLSALSVLIEYARVAKPKLPYQDKNVHRLRFFTKEEVDLVIQTLTIWGKHKERDLFIFLVDTGARPYSEGTSLRWSQIRDRRVHFGEVVHTKTAEPRTIPLTTRALEAIERRRATMGNAEGPFVDITEWQMLEVWRNIRAHLPALADTVVYTARHTCASWQVIAGIDLVRVMKWMGHKSYQTTLIYAHLTPNHLLDNLRALEGGPSGPRLTVVNGGAVEPEE